MTIHSCDDLTCSAAHGLSRRGFLDLVTRLAAAGAGATLAGCSTNSAKQASGPEPALKIGYLPICDATPLLVGHARGIFQAEGLTVEQPVLIRGWAELSEAFLAGTFNLVHLLLPIPIYMRYAQKHPVKVVAWNHMNGSAITMGPKSGVRRLEDIGGKQIAVPHWYSMHNIILQLCMRKYGLEAVMQDRSTRLSPKQVNLFVMKPPDMPTAIASGAIDGYTVAEPFNAAGEALAKGAIVRFTGDVFKNHPCCVAVMREADMQQYPEWSQKVVNGLVKAQHWSAGNVPQTATLLSKDGKNYLPSAQAVVSRGMTKYDLESYGDGGTKAIRHADWNVRRIDFQPYPFPSTTIEIVKLLKETKVEGDSAFLQALDPQRVADDLFDYALVKKAADKLGGLKMFDGVDAANPYVRTEVIAV